MEDLLYEEVSYDEIEAHWADRENWKEWWRVLYIAGNIGACKVPVSLEERVKRFVNTHRIEKAVAEFLKVEFTDETHKTFHYGNPEVATPDFKRNGITYELKTYVLDYDAYEWWGADVHLFYNAKRNILLEQKKNGTFKLIGTVKVDLL